jgi:hypothetical protein
MLRTRDDMGTQLHLADAGRLSKKEWQKYLKQSYDLLYAKLPLKVKKGIEGKK